MEVSEKDELPLLHRIDLVFPVPVETELYKVLGVATDATEGASRWGFVFVNLMVYPIDEIKKAYRKKVSIVCWTTIHQLIRFQG